MAAVTLALRTSVQNESESTALKRRRVVMPDESHLYLRIFQPDYDTFLELGDFTDATDRGSNYKTIPAGVEKVEYIGRGECAVSTDGVSVDVELEATPYPGL